VTISTGDRTVLTSERKAGFIVMEVFHSTEKLEGLLYMALFTVRTKPAAVWILVAAVAIHKGHVGEFLKG
jgi:hypothetical protein